MTTNKACVHPRAWVSQRTVAYPTGPDREPWFTCATFTCVICDRCGNWLSLGPSSDRQLEVTQELVALFYAEDREALHPWMADEFFDAGLRGDDAPSNEGVRWRWEAGALAAHLLEIGGQR